MVQMCTGVISTEGGIEGGRGGSEMKKYVEARWERISWGYKVSGIERRHSGQ